jgi:hypothetical protein
MRTANPSRIGSKITAMPITKTVAHTMGRLLCCRSPCAGFVPASAVAKIQVGERIIMLSSYHWAGAARHRRGETERTRQDGVDAHTTPR